MAEQYLSVLHRWFDEVWNQQKTDTIRELLTEDSKHHGLGQEPIVGSAAFESYHQAYITAFPDVYIEVGEVTISGETISGKYTVSATQTGDLPDLPATKKKVLFEGSGTATFPDGKFVEVWNEVDFAKMQYDLAPDTPDIE